MGTFRIEIRQSGAHRARSLKEVSVAKKTIAQLEKDLSVAKNAAKAALKAQDQIRDSKITLEVRLADTEGKLAASVSKNQALSAELERARTRINELDVRLDEARDAQERIAAALSGGGC